MTINRTWSSSKVWSYCNKFERYTRGDNAAYSRMLEFVSEHEHPTDLEVLEVAHDIVKHSNLDGYGLTEAEALQAITFDLLNDCITYDAEISEAEASIYTNRL